MPSVRKGLLCVLCFLLLLTLFEPSTLLGHSTRSDPPQTKLLVLVIAGGSAPHYTFLRSVWRMMAAQQLGVKVYLLGFSKNITTPVIEESMLLLPGKDSLIPGVLEETVEGLRYIVSQQLPGHNFEFLLRTNLSSFWRWKLLLSWLAKNGQDSNFYAGFSDLRSRPPFASGAGFILSRDNALALLQETKQLRFSVIDDVAIAELMFKRNQTVHNMPRQDFTSTDYPALLSNSFPKTFHFRVKARDEALRQRDAYIFAHLYVSTYGPCGDPLSTCTFS